MYKERKGINDRPCRYKAADTRKAEPVAELAAAIDVQLAVEVADEVAEGVPECG